MTAAPVFIALWCQGADSEILGVYSTADLALARCNTEESDREPTEGVGVVQKHDVD